MLAKTPLPLSLFLLFTILASFSQPAQPGSAQSTQVPALRLHRSQLQQHGHSLQSMPTALQLASPEYAIIQFVGPIQTKDRAALQSTGVSILEYLPDYAYLVRGTAIQLRTAATLPQVYARHDFLAMDKLEPTLLGALAMASLQKPADVSIHAWPGQEQGLQQLFTQLGIAPKQPLTAPQLMTLASSAAVRWIEPRFSPRIFNDRAHTIMDIDAAWLNHGLYGAGQIVGITDSGLDTGDLQTISPDFAGRIVATQVLSAGGTLADEYGHGTHVTGSLAGAGVRSGADPTTHSYGGSFAGVAPEASLVIQAFEVNDSGAIQGLGNDPYQIFAQAYAAGARIHSDSWGGPTGIPFLDVEGYFGGYTMPSYSTDKFIWDHPDMSIFVAAGNSGNDGDFLLLGCLPNGDGWIDDDSLMAPGTAKNAITIGASESLRLEGNLNTLTWRDFPFFLDLSCYAKDPVASDLLSNNPNGLAAFSSRGPVNDGRFKPDLVAPGTSIVSNRSSHPLAKDLWGAYSPNHNYTIAGGTSMATPLAAGAAVLIREWLSQKGNTNPSAAAIKAIMLSTSADIAPGQYVVGNKQEIPASLPNNDAGWGRVNLEFLSRPAPYKLWLDDHQAGLDTAQRVSYPQNSNQPLFVTDSSQPLRITLAWSDPPASLSASRQLVNDLDLLVTGPDGKRYWGNNIENGDRINNVEGIILQNPIVGAYRVEVQAHNAPVAQQPYALVATGALSTEPLTLMTNTGISLHEGEQAVIPTASLQAAGLAAEYMSYTVQQTAKHGKLLLDGQNIGVEQHFTQADINRGALHYLHDGSETISDSLKLSISDNTGYTFEPISFGITIVPINDQPVANHDSAETLSGQAVMIDVLTNDSDAERDTLLISAVEAAPSGISTTDGVLVTYIPPAAFIGQVTFSYTISDQHTGSATGIITISVKNKPTEQKLHGFLPMLMGR